MPGAKSGMTARGLGINPRKLGISPRQLQGKTEAEIAEAFRKAARRLLWLAKQMEAGEMQNAPGVVSSGSVPDGVAAAR
jgi:hypothetical protein